MSALALRKLQQARQRLQNGDTAGAAYLCEEVLQSAPRNPDALCLMGTIQLMTGRPQDALALFDAAVTGAPQHGPALENLGLAYLMLQDYPNAERSLRKAAAIGGAPASVRMRLGVSLLHQGRHRDAVAELIRAVAMDPTHSDARLNLGLAYAGLGDRRSAAREFEGLVSESPHHADALYNLGVIALEQGEFARAGSWFERTLAQEPRHVDARINLGITLQRQQRLDEAQAHLRQAVSDDPQRAVAASVLAEVLATQGLQHEAREQFLRALRLNAGLMDAHEGLAKLDMQLARFAEAADHLREIVRAEPANAAMLGALANACFQCGALDEAAQAAARARELDATGAEPYSVLAQIHYVRGELDQAAALLQEGYRRSTSPALLGTLVHLLHRMCDWPRWQPAWERMAALLENTSDLGGPFNLLCEDTTAQQQLSYTQRWAAATFPPAPGAAPAARSPRGNRARLRIGYFSGDFYQHPVAALVAQVLELHDRSRFEIYAYSYGPDDGSALRARVRSAVDNFVDVAREANDAIVERIAADGIDVLVDLKGYTAGDRLAVMASRPCPVQVAWLGYPGTTGAHFIDYLIADAFLIPPGAEHYYSERILRMPHCYQANDRRRALPEPRARGDYGLPADAFVFCCFNPAVKITPQVFARWMRLLDAVPGSVLWLLEDNRWANERLAGAAREAGIDAERIIMGPRLPPAEHLARYRAADVALDTFPYTSHTTGSDALWLGCPLVALCGETFAGRVSGSLLTACGLPELIAHSLDDYEGLALRLAGDADYLRAVRARLAAAREASALFDTQQFVRDLEALYVHAAK